MGFPSNTSKTNMVLLIIFLVVWTYTEVSEYDKRANFKVEVVEFMARTNRHHNEHHPDEQPEKQNEAILEK